MEPRILLNADLTAGLAALQDEVDAIDAALSDLLNDSILATELPLLLQTEIDSEDNIVSLVPTVSSLLSIDVDFFADAADAAELAELQIIDASNDGVATVDEILDYFTGQISGAIGGAASINAAITALDNLDATFEAVGDAGLSLALDVTASDISGAGKTGLNIDIDIEVSSNYSLDFGVGAENAGFNVQSGLDGAANLSLNFDAGVYNRGGAATAAADGFFALNEASFTAGAETTNFSVDANFGFLGVEIDSGDIDLNAGLNASVEAELGIETGDLGVQSASGAVTLGGNFSTNLSQSQLFSLRLGAAGEVDVSVAAGDKVNAAGLVSAVQSAVDATALNGLINVSEIGGQLRFDVLGDGPSALGFGNTTIAAGGNASGAAPTLSGFSVVASSNGGAPVLVTVAAAPDLAGMATNVQTALNSAFAGGFTVTVDGSGLNIAAVGKSLTVSDALAIETREDVASVLSAASFGGAGVGGENFNLDLNLPMDVVDNLLPDFSLVASLNPVDFSKVGDRFDFGAGLFSSVSTDVLNFNELSPAKVISLFNQIADFLGGLSESQFVSGIDIPFANANLGDVLNFADVLRDTVIYDDFDDSPTVLASTDPDIPTGENRLTDFNGTPIFSTAQDLEDALNGLAGISGVNIQYNPATDELTFGLSLSEDFTAFDTDVDFNLPLGPLGNIQSSSTVSLSGNGSLSFDLGIDLGDDVSGSALLTGATALSGLRTPVQPRAEQGITGASEATASLTADASFTLDVGGTMVSVTLDDADTSSNSNVLDLVADLRSAVQEGLGNAGLATDAVQVSSTGSRLVLLSDTAFTLTASGTAVTELGFAANASSNLDDIIIVDQNGTEYGLSLNGIADISALESAIDGLGGGGVFDLRINDDQTGLVLEDLTGGAGTMMVNITNDSTAGFALGLVGAETLDPDSPDPENPLGLERIDGLAIAGATLTDRVFIENAAASGTIDLDASGVNASASFGFVEVELEGSGQLGAGLSLGLKPSGGAVGDRITLTELLDNLGNLADLVDGPTLSIDPLEDSISLEVSVEPSFSDFSLTAGTPTIGLQVLDLGDPLNGVAPNINITTPDFGDLAKFDDIGFDDVLTGLLALTDFLDDFESFGFLNEPLPLIDTSVNDLLGFVDSFAASVQVAIDNPAGSLQTLETALSDALGIPDNLIGLDLDGDILKFSFDLADGFAESLGLNFDLADFLDDLSLDPAIETILGAASLAGSANLIAEGNFDLDLDFGIDLGFDGENSLGDVYVYDSTGLSGNLTVAGQDLAFRGALGPVGLFINEYDDGAGNVTPAEVAISAGITAGLNLGSSRELISDINLGSDFAINVVGDAGATLPVFTPTESNFAGVLEFGVPDLLNPVPSLTGLDDIVSAFDPSNISLFDSLLLAVDGIDLVLGGVQDLLDGALGELSLPLIGDKLIDVTDFIADFRDDFIDPLREGVEAVGDPDDDPIAGLLDQLLDDELGLLIGDVGVTTNIDDPMANPDELFIEWDVVIGDDIANLDAGIGFDLGIPGLGLETDGDLLIGLDWEFAFGFGISATDGFYLKIDDPDELQLTLDVDLPASITGSLGFLQLTASDRGNTGLDATFGIDINNSKDASDDKLGFSELSNIGITPVINASARADLDLELAVDGDVLGDDFAAVFPDLSAGFDLQWELGSLASPVPLADLSTNLVKDGLKLVEFQDITLDLGSYINNVLGPILDEVNGIVEPIKPILDFLTEPLPVISDIGPDVTMIDLAKTFGNVDLSFINSVAQVADLVSTIASFGEDPGGLNFGDFMLFDVDDPGMSSIDLTDPKADLKSITKPTPPTPTPGGGSATAKLISGDGFQFPILSDPSQIFNVLLGEPATLVTYDFGTFLLNFKYRQFFPIFGPLGASIGGQIGAEFDFDFGFDTLGISQFADSGFRNPGLIFNGFFISDTDNPDGSFGTDVPEIVVSGGLTASAELNLGIASGGVEGGVFTVINFDLFDPNRDGKVRIEELIGNFVNEVNFGSPALAPLAVFDVAGEIFVRLYAFLRINLLFITKSFEFNIVPPTTILEFGTDFFRPPKLASVLDNGVLQLNMGDFADLRLNGNTNDISENFTVTSLSDSSVRVTAAGFGPGGSDLTQDYDIGTSLTRVIALGGEGNDTIDLDGITTANVFYEVDGGAGSDTITLGTGAGSESLVTGGVGNDNITGSAGDDVIFGDEGNDTISGLGGADVLAGDSADVRDDSIRARAASGDGNDTIDGGIGSDIILGAGGDDILNGGANDDIVIGDGGRVILAGMVVEDTNRGLNGGRDTIGGDSGLDKLFGGRGNDIINGGDDADMIFGDDGFDTLNGDGGADMIEGGREDDTINGGDQNDTISGGQGADVISGGDGADTIDGDGEGDEIRGGAGNDDINGGDGADLIFGDGGADTIQGSIGSDTIYGDSSTDNDIDDAGVGTSVDPDPDSAGDTIFGGLGNDTIYGGGGGDTIFGDAGDDLIDGDWGNDLIDGDNGLGGDSGNDRIYGDFGDDDIYSYEGNDFLDGAAGTDEYFVYVYGEAESEDTDAKRVEIFDRGALNAGADEATIFAPNDSTEQIFLLRASADLGGIGFVTTLNGPGEDILERIDYDGNLESLVINAYGGDDQFFVDDNRAVTRIEGGAGNDFFQVGQVFETLRDQPNANIADPRDVFATIETTVGFLSNGTTEAMTINGGSGEDNFSVFHNKAVLTLNGNDGNDTFRVRAFALAGSQENLRDRTDISGGTDADTILYAVNAPVNIDGGDGLDTVIVTGTEFGDDFVITESGIFGGGLNVNYVNIELLTVDGAEGDDRFFIQGTSANAVTEVSGGLGSDSFNIAGDTPPIISNDLLGHSGIISHSVTSLDPLYDNTVAEGVSVNVADDNEPGVRITPIPGAGGAEIFEGGGAAALSAYTIVLTRPPRPGETVTITAVAPEPSQEEQDQGKALLQFIDPDGVGGTEVQDGGTKSQVTFTAANWDTPQEIRYQAINDGVAEGDQSGFINHTVASTFSIDFDGATGINNEVTNLVDNDASFVENELIGGLVKITGGTGEGQVRAIVDNTATELSLAFGWNIVPDNTSTYEIISSETPLGGSVDSAANRVTVTLAGAGFETLGSAIGEPDNDQGNLRGATLEIVGGEGAGQQALILSNTDDTLTVNRPWLVTPDATSEFQISRYGGLAIPSVEVFISEGAPSFVDFPDSPAPTPGVNVIETLGSTDVVEGVPGSQDSYSVVLTAQPTDDVIVTINAEETITTRGNIFYNEPQVTVSSASDINADPNVLQLRFTPANWDTPQTVDVGAIDDDVVDGGDTKVFAPIPKVVNKIQGDLILNGAGGDGSATDFDPKLLPGETNQAPSLGTVISGGVNSITVAASEIPENFGSDLTNFTLEIVNGTGEGQTRLVSASSVNAGVATLLVGEDWDVVPDATSEYAITRTNPNLLVDEAEQVDILTVFNNDSRSDDSGTLTEDTLSMNIMGGDTFYNDLENVTVNLGFGDDTFAVNSTHTREDGFETITMLNAGVGDDIIDVNLAADNGNFVVKGEEGDDVIDAFDSALGVTIFGDEGADTLTGGAGDDLILGDLGRVDFQDADGRITARFGLQHDFANMPDEVLVGDPTFLMPANQTDGVDRDPSLVLSLDTGIGDVDTIIGNEGDDIIIGGQGGDSIDSGAGNDTVGGDALILTYSDGSESGATDRVNFSTLDVENGGADTIIAGSEDDTVLGGRDGDIIDASSGNNVLLGDHGTIVYVDGNLASVNSTDPDEGGADTITSGAGNDVVVGGTAGDDIVSAAGADIVLGDSGTLVADPTLTTVSRIILESLQSTAPGIGGADTIDAGEDDDVVIGGAEGDIITAGEDDGEDVILGDNGEAIFDPALGGSILREIRTSSPEFGGDDFILAGNGFDVVLGGSFNDEILAGSDGARDVVIGDNGEALFTEDALVTFVQTTDTLTNDFGGDDIITTGNGPDVVLGGSGDDTVLAATAGSEADLDAVLALIAAGSVDLIQPGDSEPDVILGDNGYADFTDDRTLLEVVSTEFDLGGDDTIVAGNGADVVIGGFGDDFIYASGNDHEPDIVIGDSGRATFEGTEAFRGATDDDPTGEEFAVLSFNFAPGNTNYTAVRGEAGAPDASGSGLPSARAGNWNNLTDDSDGDDDDDDRLRSGTFGDNAGELVLFDNGEIAPGVSIRWGADIDSSNPRDLSTDTHSQIRNPDTDDERLFEGYLHTSTSRTVGVDIDGLGRHFETYDVYVYLDADNGKSNRSDSVRGITDGDTTFYLDDPDGNTFEGTYVRVDSTDANAPEVGNYVVFTGLTSDQVSLRIDDVGTRSSNRPAISGVQVVGQSLPIDRIETTAAEFGGNDMIYTGGGRDIVLGGSGSDLIDTFGDADLGEIDPDIVVGDNGEVTFFLDDGVSEARDVRTTDSDAVGSFDDTITTGNGEDIVIGGLGNDDIDTGDRGARNGVDDTLSNGDIDVVSINFNSDNTEAAIEGNAGAVVDLSWNNLDNDGHGDDDDRGDDDDDDRTPPEVFSVEGLDVTVGQDLDGRWARAAGIDTHNGIDPDTQNERLFESYVTATGNDPLGIDISGLDARFSGGAYDVYLYLDADDARSLSDTSIRLVSLNGETRSLNDPDGNTFEGEFIEWDAGNTGSPATLLVFRDVTGNDLSLRIDDTDDRHGDDDDHPRSAPSIAGMQIVSGADKDDVIRQGDFDSDRVLGDQGWVRILDEAFEMIAEPLGAAGSDDTILGGQDGDVLIGGDGGDAINGESGDDVLVGDNARVILFDGEVIDLDIRHGDDNDGDDDDDDFGFDPFDLVGVQQLAPGVGGDDSIEGGADNDWSFGGVGDDVYVFAGLQLGTDRLVESGGGNDIGGPEGFGNDSGDRLDFSGFEGPVDVDLGKKSTQIVSAEYDDNDDDDDDDDVGEINLSVTLFSGQAFEEVVGSEFDDDIDGNKRDNLLLGLGGNDKIDGKAGIDLIDGGLGDDRLDGGGNDHNGDDDDGDDDDDSGANVPDVVIGGGGHDLIKGRSDAFIQATSVGGGAATLLTQSQLDAAVAEARGQWQDAGLLSKKDRKDLDKLDWHIADYGGLVLGEQTGKRDVRIDSDAAGHGWFIDGTSTDSAEFADSEGNALLAEAGSPASERIDLLTVIHHQIANVLGYENYTQDGVLAELLAPGTRYELDTLDSNESVTYIFDDNTGEIVPERGSFGGIADTPVP